MGFLFWFLCIFLIVALVLLLFPFYFKIDFEIGERGCWAHFFFFKKKIYSIKKKWGKSEVCEEEMDLDEGDSDEGDFGEPAFVDTTSVTSKKEPAKFEDKAVEKSSSPVVANSSASVGSTEKSDSTHESGNPGIDAAKEEAPKATEIPKPVEKNAVEKKPEKENSAEKNSKSPVVESKTSASVSVKEKTPKRKLTERELWTILLTPDLDVRAFRYVKKLLGVVLRLFRVKFRNCFVEGIRLDYDHMGYGAALNGFLKSFPYIGAWDFRMDWCHEADLRAAGTIHASVNLNRVFGLLLIALYYSGVLGLCFWFRRKKVLKTGELPELGFIRKKILDFILEE